VKLILHVRWLV